MKDLPIKKFEWGKKYVFDAELFKALHDDPIAINTWVRLCDGKEVRFRKDNFGVGEAVLADGLFAFHISVLWCREVIENKIEEVI